MTDSNLERKTETKRKVFHYLSLCFLVLTIVFSFVGSQTIVNDDGISIVSSFTVIYGPTTSQFNTMGRLHVLAILVATLLLFFSQDRRNKNIALFLVILSIIAFLTRNYYYGYIVYGVDEFDTEIALYFFKNVFNILVLVFSVCAIIFVALTTVENSKFTVMEMTEIAVFVGLALLLDQPFMKIRLGASGGSISLEWVPLIVICLRHGAFKGFVACGIIHGFISCIIGGYGIAYYPFDYLFAFGSLALIGIMPNRMFESKNKSGYKFLSLMSLATGLLIVTFIKTIVHTISGVIFWETPFAASFVYNVVPNAITGAITVVAILLLSGPLTIINRKFPVRSK